MSGIYSIKNLINNKIYIGKTGSRVAICKINTGRTWGHLQHVSS
jgi:hypothetical protein